MIKLHYFNVSLALTSNEHYVIIAGGYHHDGYTSSSAGIFILDIRNKDEYKLRKCDIKTPKAG